jgi:fibronectin-binding autotransporter adhesin
MLRAFVATHRLLIPFVALALSGLPANAQSNYYWNAGTGGGGAWDTSSTLWSLNPGGPVDQTWLNDGTALANFGDTAGTVTVSSVLNASGLNFSTTGYIIAGSSGNSITLMGGGVIDTASFNATVGAVLDGSVGLTKNGTGTLSISGTNLYTGVTTVNAGTLLFTSTAGLGATGSGNNTVVNTGASLTLGNNAFNPSEAVTINGTGTANEGALRKIGNTNSNLSGAITVASAARINSDTTGLFTLSGAIGAGANNLTVGGSGNTTISGIITQSGTLTKDGNGTLTLGANNSTTLTGPVTITGGVVSIPLSTSLGTTGLITINGGTLRNTNTGSGGSFVSATRGISIGASGGTVDFTSAASTNSSIYAGTITGTGTLTKVGNAEFRYQGTGLPNTTYTKLVVNEGLFRLGFASSTQDERGFGAVPASPTADAITLNGGAIGTSFNVVLNVNRGITLGAAGGSFTTAAGQMTIPGIITGSGDLNKNTAGTLVLSGANNYTGATNISAGTISAAATNTLSSSSAVVLSNVSSAVLDLGGFDQAVASLAGGGGTGGNVTLGAGTLTTGGNNSSTSYGGVISGTGGFVKQGSGAQTLSGVNTYTGATTVNGGTLLVGTGGSIASGSAIAVNNTGTFGGTGTASGSVTVNSGGTISGGIARVGTLTVGGNVTLNTGAQQFFGITAAGTPSSAGTGGSSNGTIPNPTNNNFLDIGGSILPLGDTTTFHFTVDGTGTTFDGSQSYSYRVARVGTDAIGAFIINDQSQFTAVGFAQSFNFSVSGDGLGNVYLNLAPVPEPATILGLAAGVLGLGGLVRRRRRGAQTV